MSGYYGITCRDINICNRPAETIIIYGCLEQHLNELALCKLCHTKWEYMYRQENALCRDCGFTAQSYAALPITDATEAYIQEYVLQTYGDNSRRPYIHESSL